MGWRPLRHDDHDMPRPIGEGIARVLRHLGAPAPDALETVFGQWRQLVGERIAEHAEPVSIDRGVLTVRAGDPAWANQLQWLERDLLRRLEDALGPGVIRSIVVRTGTVSSRPNARRQPRRRR